MNHNILIKDSEKYEGKYVATKSFHHNDVIVSGNDPSDVIKQARQVGIKNPVVFFVPESNMVHIY